jgi:hypothetical protein
MIQTVDRNGDGRISKALTCEWGNDDVIIYEMLAGNLQGDRGDDSDCG